MRVAAFIPPAMVEDQPAVRCHLEMVAAAEGLVLTGPVTTRLLSDAHHSEMFGGEPTTLGLAECDAEEPAP